MDELIKIKEENGNQIISARELHEFLGNKERFSKWFTRMCEYGFIEGEDYTAVPKGTLSSLSDDYALILDMAKELSMLARNEKGKIARKYFITSDKRRVQLEQNKLPNFENPIDAARAWADEREARMLEKVNNLALTAKVEEQKPKVDLFQRVVDADRAVSMGDFAQVMKIKDEHGKLLGRNSLISVMREAGIIKKYGSLPFQKYVENGWFRVTTAASGHNAALVYPKFYISIKKRIIDLIEIKKSKLSRSKKLSL